MVPPLHEKSGSKLQLSKSPIKVNFMRQLNTGLKQPRNSVHHPCVWILEEMFEWIYTMLLLN